MRRDALAVGTVGVALLVGTGPVAAQHGPGGSMGDGWGWGPFGGWLVLGAVLVLALVAIIAISSGRTGGMTEGRDRALSELRERYARGELSDEEFEKRRRRLQERREDR